MYILVGVLGNWNVVGNHRVSLEDGNFSMQILDTNNLVCNVVTLRQLEALYVKDSRLRVVGVSMRYGRVYSVYIPHGGSYGYKITCNYVLLYEIMNYQGNYANGMLIRKGVGIVAKFELPHINPEWVYDLELEEMAVDVVIRVILRSGNYTVYLSNKIVYVWDGIDARLVSMLTADMIEQFCDSRFGGI